MPMGIQMNTRQAMKSKLIIIFALVGLSVSLLTSDNAAAHVIIRDDANTTGAVLHVTPDDNPIAGEHSDLFFSLEGESLTGSQVSIVITNTSTQESAEPATSLTASGIVAQYTFPSRGTYDISLSISGKADYTFSHVQRVSRGIGTDTSIDSSYPLARAGIILSVAATMLLIAIAYARRKLIFKQSVF